MDETIGIPTMNFTKAQLLEMALTLREQLTEKKNQPVTPPEAVRQPGGILVQVETRTTTNQSGEEATHRRIIMEAGEIFFTYDEEGNPVRVGSWEEATVGFAFLPNHIQRYVDDKMLKAKPDFFHKLGINRSGTYVVPVERGGENKTGWIIGGFNLRLKGKFLGKPMILRFNGSLGTQKFVESPKAAERNLPPGWTSFNVQMKQPGGTIYSGMTTVFEHLRLAVALATGPWFSFGKKGEERPAIDTPFVKEFKGRFIDLSRRSGAAEEKEGSAIDADQFSDYASEPAAGTQTSAGAATTHTASMPRPTAFGTGW